MVHHPEKFFITESAKYIFALLYMDGWHRIKTLDMPDSVYYNADEFSKWYNHINKSIHTIGDNSFDMREIKEAEKELNTIAKHIREALESDDYNDLEWEDII